MNAVILTILAFVMGFILGHAWERVDPGEFVRLVVGMFMALLLGLGLAAVIIL